MEKIESTTIDEMVASACTMCEGQLVTNLILHGTFPYGEVDSPLIRMSAHKAEEWQGQKKPSNFWINHGEYIYRHGDAKAFLIKELRYKRDSNRAFLSLVDMEDIIDSGDLPIPSFLILQFTFPGESWSKLSVTAYFRAIEVSKFLAINLAEICCYVREFKIHFPDITEFEVVLHACRAYFRPDFSCLEKADIDIASPVDVAFAVLNKKLDILNRWLNSKIAVDESVVCTDGIACLLEATKKCSKKYKKDLIFHLEEALERMKRLKSSRESASYSSELDKLNIEVKHHLKEAQKNLK